MTRSVFRAPATMSAMFAAALLATSPLTAGPFPASPADPASVPGAATASPASCWHPDAAPALFGRSTRAALACRNPGKPPRPATHRPAAHRHAAPASTLPPASPQNGQTRIIFSGSAYAGIAASF